MVEPQDRYLEVRGSSPGSGSNSFLEILKKKKNPKNFQIEARVQIYSNGPFTGPSLNTFLEYY